MPTVTVFNFDTSKYTRVFTTHEKNPPIELAFILENTDFEKVRQLEKTHGKLSDVPAEEMVDAYPFNPPEKPVYLEKTKREHPEAKPNLNKQVKIPVREIRYNFMTPLVF